MTGPASTSPPPTAPPAAPAQVCVVMPTYKRPDLLPRAVASVLNQSLTHWRLIIADDEDPPGPTWDYLRQLAASDPRITALRNPGPHGQIGNNNFVLQHAAATGIPWIKPLFDDDALKPDCLTHLLAAAQGRAAGTSAGNLALVRCLADHFIDHALAKRGRRGRCAPLERLGSQDALRAVYLQDLEIGTPVQWLLHRDAIAAGVLWEFVPDMPSGFDTWWVYRVIARGGDVLLLNEALIDQHWGHESGTAAVQRRPELLDQDLYMLRRLVRPLIHTPPEHPDAPRLPSLSIVEQQVNLMRALLRLRDGRPCSAIRLVCKAPHPQAWSLAWRWLRNKRRPGTCPLVPRQTLSLPLPAGPT
jgi:hypothetical protein